ncbi:ImmA/IrrE family metallo-endopeptidase [bacterium]|nr:ImmA/IrrE family metallo-endopeptidase [bacterium]
MPKIIRAEITPATVTWARKYANIDIDLLAKKVGVKSHQISAWELGDALPTINQLYKLAKVCDVPFSLFFFETPPDDIPLPVNDYRKIYSSYGNEEISYDLTLEIRKATRIRKLALEVFEDMEIDPPKFSFWIDAGSEEPKIAKSIRNYLGISFEQQKSWKDPRIAFNHWRGALENVGIIVLQSTRVEVSTMRGFSLSKTPLPVIVVNRKDEYAGRVFSLLHELIHVATNTSGLCDFISTNQLEIYCNRLAAEILMPTNYFLQEVHSHLFSIEEPSDSEIFTLSKIFSVSRISITRHLLTKGLISKDFYRQKQDQYQEEYEQIQDKRKRSKGYLIKKSPIDIISQNGHLYPSMVMDAYYDKKITMHDAVSMLDTKTRHLDALFAKLSANRINS